MNKRLLALILVVSANDTLAQSDALNVVVTASRQPEISTDALASVTVITRKQIETSQYTSLADALQNTPGVVISNNGGPSKLTELYLRGTSAKQVLVLLDGIKIGSVTTGIVQLETIDLNNVERIEIVRGPKSSLYGSEAVGGVINIISRSPDGLVVDRGLSAQYSLSVGSNESLGSQIRLAESFDRFSYDLALSKTRTTGNTVTTAYPDNDGASAHSISFNPKFKLTDTVSLSAGYSDTLNKTEYDGGTYDNSDNAYRTSSVAVKWIPNHSLESSLSLGRTVDYAKDYLGDVFKSKIVTTRDVVTAQTRISQGLSRSTLGLDYMKDSVTGTQRYDLTERDNIGLFALHQSEIGGFDYQISGRIDDNEQFGYSRTYGLGLGYNFSRNRVRANVGSAFKAPTFNDLYWPLEVYPLYSSDYAGNPNLEPETSKSWELGYDGAVGAIDWSVVRYSTSIKNLIAYDWDADPSTTAWYEGRMVNVDRAEINGTELQARFTTEDWKFRADLDFTDPRNKSDGTVLNRQARRKASLELIRYASGWDAGLRLNAVGHRTDGSNDLPGYGLVDVFASYSINENLKVSAKVGNLLDKEYFTAKTLSGSPFLQDGRNWSLRLTYTPSSR